MAAITWHNINGPSLADASRPLQVANDTINNGFAAFNNVLNKTEATDQANWNQIKQNNTEAFMAKLYEANGAEGFKALQDSGELARMIAANGAQIDRAAARTAMDTRLGTLQQRDLDTINYTNKVLDNQQAPIMESLKVAAQKGDQKGFDAIVAANPNLRHLSGAYESMRKVGYEIADENQKALMRPEDLRAKKLSNAGAATNNALGSINLTKAQIELKDAQDTRAIDNEVAAETQNYLKNKNAIGRNMGVIAKAAGLPVDSAGHPDFSNYNSKDLDAFDKAASQNRQITVPKARDFITGDTQVANAFLTRLQDSGKYRPALLKKFSDSIRSSFDSNASSASVGNDRFNKQLATAQNKVKFDEQDAQNWYAPGADNATTAYEQLAKELPGLIDKTSGAASDEDMADLQNFVGRMGSQGIEVAPAMNGQPAKYMIPSVQDMRRAIRTAEGSYFFDNSRAQDAEKKLKKIVKDSFTQEKLDQAEESLKFRRKEKVNAILTAK